MGEVDRADDLTLGQPVALKFLPEAAASNEDFWHAFATKLASRAAFHTPSKPPPSQLPDWNLLFPAPGLDPAQFHTVEPAWNSLAPSDTRVAWTGIWPVCQPPTTHRSRRLARQACLLLVDRALTRPWRMERSSLTSGQKATQAAAVSLAILVLVLGVLIARRNYVQGRGDLRSASRIVGAVFVIKIVGWLC
jgi:hypothetical protein